MVTTV